MTARPRRRLGTILTRRLLAIAGVVIVANVALVALIDAQDRKGLVIDTLRRELSGLEAALGDGPRPGAPEVRVAELFRAHPGSYAFAVLDPDGRLVAGENVGLFPAGSLRSHGEAGDWIAWTGDRVDTVVAARASRALGAGTTILFLIDGDPAGLIRREILDEFLGHVGLPLLPIALLMIVGSVLVIRRGLAPVAKAAAWARAIRPGAPIPAFEDRNLPAEIADLTDATRRSLERLNRELAAEQRRAAEAAHALRTPLAVIVARLDDLPREAAFDRLRTDIQALSRTVTQFLASAGADRLELEPGDRAELNAIAEGAVADLVPLARSRGAEIAFCAADGARVVHGSAQAISLALRNLIENAIFHGSGAPVEVTVGPGHEIAVRDHGPGLAGESRERLFEPFRRGAAARPGGAGLGLSIVARIQHNHGGAVEVADAPGGGALFRMSYRAA